jgi:hypothetical protein
MRPAYFLLGILSLAGYMFAAFTLLMPLTYSWTLDLSITEAAGALYGDPQLMVQGGETLTPAALLAAIGAGLLLGVGAGAYRYFRLAPVRPILTGAACAACITCGVAAIYAARGEFGFGASQQFGLAALLAAISAVLCFVAARALLGRGSHSRLQST